MSFDGRRARRVGLIAILAVRPGPHNGIRPRDPDGRDHRRGLLHGRRASPGRLRHRHLASAAGRAYRHHRHEWRLPLPRPAAGRLQGHVHAGELRRRRAQRRRRARQHGRGARHHERRFRAGDGGGRGRKRVHVDGDAGVHQLQVRRVRGQAGHESHPGRHRRPGPRGHRQQPEPEPRPGDHRGCLCLRQRVPAQRCGHKRQPVRLRPQPVRRGCLAGDLDPHRGHLRRIRPLLGRRHQRHHQERRERLLRQLPHRPHQPVLAGREPRGEDGHRGRPRTASHR